MIAELCIALGFQLKVFWSVNFSGIALEIARFIFLSAKSPEADCFSWSCYCICTFCQCLVLSVFCFNVGSAGRGCSSGIWRKSNSSLCEVWRSLHLGKFGLGRGRLLSFIIALRIEILNWDFKFCEVLTSQVLRMWTLHGVMSFFGAFSMPSGFGVQNLHVNYCEVWLLRFRIQGRYVMLSPCS